MLRVRLMGALEVELDGAVIDSPPSQRPWAVFAYLALSPRPVSRAELAERFWPDVLDQSARASLRSALWTLRRQLGASLAVDRERIALHDVWIDTREFDRLAEADAREEALALYEGELLEGMEDEWALSARVDLRDRVIAMLEHLAQQCDDRGHTREAIDWTRRQVQRDPFDEAAHRRLLVRLDAAGDRAAALRANQAFVGRLRRELAVAPSAQTRALVERLRIDLPAAVAPPVTVRPPTLLELVGRGAELARLDAVWQTARGGAGAVACLRGEAGIGKTRLAMELVLRAAGSGGRTATCAALDLGGSAPLSLWAELIRELLPALPAPPADAAWLDDLAVLVGELPPHFARHEAPAVTVAPDLQRTRLYEAVVALLSWAARDRALLLVLEDVHTADRPSLELAGYVARRAAEAQIMMLLTRRELPPSSAADQLEHALRSRGLLAAELTLEPLGPGPLAALAREAASLSEDDVNVVVTRAEGNALLAVETARALGRGATDAVAPSLRGMVRATLGSLSGEARVLVELVAIAARGLEPAEVLQFGLSDAADDASEAVHTGLLADDGSRLGFRHALLRDAVYEEIGSLRRAGLHRRWAAALLASERVGTPPRPAEAARQLRLAGADTDAVPQLARAAGQARAVAALEQAVAYLEEALAIAPDREQLWLELGEIEAWRGRRAASEIAFDRALTLLEPRASLELARAYLRRARAYHGPICFPPGVLKDCQRALELLDGLAIGAPAEHHEALAALAWAHAVTGSVDEAERLLVRLGSSASAGDLHTYDVGHARALALMRRGRFAESYAPAIAAGDAISRAGRPDLSFGCWVNAAGAAAAAGEPERALEFLTRGLTAVQRRGLQSLEIHLLAARAFVLTRLQQLDDARVAVDAEWRLAEELGQPELLAMAYHDRGLVALEAGDYPQAARLLSGALVEGAPISRPMTRIALAEALAGAGELEGAAEQLRDTVLEPVRPSDFPEALVPRLARAQGLIALANDDKAAARRRLKESISGWERLRDRARGGDSMTAVLADLGRPVVGLVEPERELARTRDLLDALTKGTADAVVQ